MKKSLICASILACLALSACGDNAEENSVVSAVKASLNGKQLQKVVTLEQANKNLKQFFDAIDDKDKFLLLTQEDLTDTYTKYISKTAYEGVEINDALAKEYVKAAKEQLREDRYKDYLKSVKNLESNYETARSSASLGYIPSAQEIIDTQKNKASAILDYREYVKQFYFTVVRVDSWRLKVKLTNNSDMPIKRFTFVSSNGDNYGDWNLRTAIKPGEESELMLNASSSKNAGSFRLVSITFIDKDGNKVTKESGENNLRGNRLTASKGYLDFMKNHKFDVENIHQTNDDNFVRKLYGDALTKVNEVAKLD